MSGPISSSNPELDRDGLLVGVTPDSAGWEYVERRTDDTEICSVILSGRCTASTHGAEYPDHEWLLG